MANPLETAIAKIRSVGDRFCENQIYEFDDYKYDPELCVGDATAVCNRLGIPVTDEIVIQYPANRTFSPLPPSKIAALENAVGASLPDDYKRLLATFGAFHLPGSASICFYSPPTAVSTSCRNWWFDDPMTMPLLAISYYHQHCDGDCIGFIRNADKFDSTLYVFKHDLRDVHHGNDDPAQWSEPLAESLAAFIVAYIESLA